MVRRLGWLLVLASTGCVGDRIFADDEGFFDTGGRVAEVDCLRFEPGILNFVDGVTELPATLRQVCEFPIHVEGLTLDDPDGAFGFDPPEDRFPGEFAPGEGLELQVRFVATDAVAHEGQLLSQVQGFDGAPVAAGVAQLYGKGAE